LLTILFYTICFKKSIANFAILAIFFKKQNFAKINKLLRL